MSSLSFVPFDAFWLLLSALLVTLARILQMLRGRHQALWEELGRPGLLPRAGLASSAKLSRFYWSRRVGALGDSELHRWVLALRVLQLLLAVVLVHLWVSFAGTL